jgi:cell division septal protein FtsQ
VTAVLDDRARHRARSRASAATILDEPRVIRRFLAVDGDLRATPRRRSSRPVDEEAGSRRPAPATRREQGTRRRPLAIGVLIVQIALLATGLWLPAFQVSGVQVTGTALLSSDAVVAASGLQGSTSVFRVDGDAVRARLLGVGWIRSAVVETELPNTVRIRVQEMVPIMRLRTHGRDLLVAASGASMPVDQSTDAAAGGLPLWIDDRRQGGPEFDAAAAGGSLARMLALTAQQYPAAFGCGVASFQWGGDNVLAINATTGWKAILGHVDNQAAVDRMVDQMAALAALKGSLDFAHPKFGYVDLENPATPAVGGAPGAVAPGGRAPGPAPGRAAAAPTAAPATPAPTPTAPPTPAPTPTAAPIHQFVLPPPPSPPQ